jgi:hypothetical protein
LVDAGHTFCRQCLKQAAEKELRSCAMCRTSHVLDPDALRASFNAKRLANMAWRLGEGKAEVSFSTPLWESAPSSPNRSHKQHMAGGAICGGGGSSLRKAKGSGKGSECSDSCSAAKDALPHATRPPHSKGLQRYYEADTDCGACPVGELQTRWSSLLQRASGSPCSSAAPPLGHDIGALPVMQLSSVWRSSTADTSVALGVDKDVGAACAKDLRARWTLLTAACASTDAGALDTTSLATRWTSLATQFTHKDAGDESTASLSRRWGAVCGVAVLPADVGACSSQSLGSRASELLPTACIGQDAGALSAQELSERAVELSACGGLGADVGALSGQALQARWSTEGGKDSDRDVGATAQRELGQRWLSLLSTCGGSDVGAQSGEALSRTWTAAHASMAH